MSLYGRIHILLDRSTLTLDVIFFTSLNNTHANLEDMFIVHFKGYEVADAKNLD